MEYSGLPLFGQVTSNEKTIITMPLKSGSKAMPGDFIKIVQSTTGTDPKITEVTDMSAEADDIYGVVVGITDADFGIISILLKGTIIANISGSLYKTGLKAGDLLKKKTAPNNCFCRRVTLLAKIDVWACGVNKVWATEKTSGYEVCIG